jgi:hypothetical protein
MHGLSFPEFACHVFPRRSPAEPAACFLPKAFQHFLANWFDQLGLFDGLQQFRMDGKKSTSAARLRSYRIE